MAQELILVPKTLYEHLPKQAEATPQSGRQKKDATQESAQIINKDETVQYLDSPPAESLVRSENATMETNNEVLTPKPELFVKKHCLK